MAGRRAEQQVEGLQAAETRVRKRLQGLGGS
jgi:hypothetical protein